MRLRVVMGALRFGAYLQFLAARPPRENTVSLQERLASFPAKETPVEKRVEIRWNRHQVPFIEARTDRDLAVALGLVHAHLRLGQMETLRRVAFGRISEMIGPAGLDFDHAVRILDLGRAVPEIERQLPAETKEWLSGFVSGINHCSLRMDAALPHEFSLFDLKREPWAVRDILTLGRLYASDFMWLIWLNSFGPAAAADGASSGPDLSKWMPRRFRARKAHPAAPHCRHCSQVAGAKVTRLRCQH